MAIWDYFNRRKENKNNLQQLDTNNDRNICNNMNSDNYLLQQSLDNEKDLKKESILLFIDVINALIIYKINEEDKEKQRLSDLINKIDKVLNSYKSYDIDEKNIPVSFKYGKKFDCKQTDCYEIIVNSVTEYKNNLNEIKNEYNHIVREINTILECNNNYAIDDKYSYLLSKKESLNLLKKQKEILYNNIISPFKIKIPNENDSVLTKFKLALFSLLESEKCVFEDTKSEFLGRKRPTEPYLFDYSDKPLIFMLDEFYFCVFNSIILVFDNDGLFSTALNATAVSVDIQRIIVEINPYGNKPINSSKYIGKDSRCIQKDMCNTGINIYGPNTENNIYSLNTKNDIYEYGKIKIEISNLSIVLSISSEKAVNDFEELKEACKELITMEITKEINKIVDIYTPKEYAYTQNGIEFICNAKFINKQVILTVKKYKNEIKEREIINNSIKEILYRDDFNDIEEKYEYLKANIEVLDQLKKVSEKLYNEISKRKIQILNEDEQILSNIKKAFELPRKSYKCTVHSNARSNKLVAATPIELCIFEYSFEPKIVTFGDFYFCLFSNVIIVFDYNGIFSTALDPSILNVDIENRIENVSIYSNGFFSKYTDIDSKCLNSVDEKVWAYVDLNGRTDLKYKNNYQIDVKRCTYEYGIITLKIQDFFVEYTTSSEKAIAAFMVVMATYAKRYYHLFNPVPDLLSLLCNVSDKDDKSVRLLVDNYNSNFNDYNIFCKEITIQ
ncbi:MAG: hypothetical protein LUG60_00055 [Erysipelotrichaceae bacterium]|nr:hypothetical protein [Erysipelotrichaceae bacterium]